MEFATAILTTRNSVMISMSQNTENVRTVAENTTVFRGFQAEYEGSIPPHPLQFFGALAESPGFYSDKRGYFILRAGAISGLHLSPINPGITPATARTNNVSRARITTKS
jgi:hypothetical protein